MRWMSFLEMRARFLTAGALCVCLVCAGQAGVCKDASKGSGAAAGKTIQKKNKGLHGKPWAFGHSADRNSALWNKGVTGKDISRRATPGAGRKKATDTRGGIDRALARAGGGQHENNLALRVKNESSAWKVEPGQKKSRPDEYMTREGRHVLGAYAGVAPAEGVKINIGPELILKDEQHSSESANASQPDSVLGLGMNFELDF